MASPGSVTDRRRPSGHTAAPAAPAPPPSPPTRLSLLVVGGGLAVLLVIGLAVFLLGKGWEEPATRDPNPTPVDTFDRPDAATLGQTDEGVAWQAVSGRWGILQERAHALGPIPENTVVLATTAAVADGRIAVTMPSVADNAGLAFRAKGPANLWAVVRGPAGTWLLVRSINGQLLPFNLSRPTSAEAGDRVEVRLEGGIIDVWVNGTFLGGVYDTTFADIRSAGLVGRGPRTVFARWDDFEVHDDL